MYVDKSALPQYQTDNYLYLDKYDSNYDIGTTYTDGGSEGVNLSDNAPLLGNSFTQELRFYFDPLGEKGGQVLGNESFKAPSISFHKHGTEIRYGFFTDGVVGIDAIAQTTHNRKRVTKLNFTRAWHHIATTFDGTNYRLFLDGEEIDNTTAFQGLTPPNTERVTLSGSREIGIRKLFEQQWALRIQVVIWRISRQTS